MRSKIKKKNLPTERVKPEPDNASMRPISKVDWKNWFPLPKEFETAETTGITTTIKRGDNTFDIELK